MAVQLNHTIIWCRDKARSARFLTEILGLPEPAAFFHFLVVPLENGISLDFAETEKPDISPQHYAFLISEAEFDGVFARVKARGLTYWADPARHRRNEINRNDGGPSISRTRTGIPLRFSPAPMGAAGRPSTGPLSSRVM